MARFLTGVSSGGTIKSIQHISTGTLSNNNYTTVTISSVDTSKSVIIANGIDSGYAGAAGNDVRHRSGGANGRLESYLDSSTGVRVTATNRDIFGRNYYNFSGVFYGTVIEYS